MQSSPIDRRPFHIIEGDVPIKVYPLSYSVLEQHADAVAFVLNAAMQMDAKGVTDAAIKGDTTALWALLAPFAGRQILQMVNACCVPSLAETYAPPDVVTEACGKWLELSFLQRGSFDRLIKAAESLAKAATGEGLDLRSRLQSLLASASSSPKSTGASGSTGIPNAVGQSQNGSNVG